MKKTFSDSIAEKANQHSDFIAGAGIGYAIGVLIGLTYAVCLFT
jgi:hypothetical protein